jgi:hypothetical protein
MKTSINDGGPAFPRPVSHSDEGGTHFGFTGMTLRDYFAGQALAGFIAASTGRDVHSQPAARMCYQMADAMLAARERKEDAP